MPEWMHRPVLVTLVLLAALAAVFLKGLREAVGLAVPIVAVYPGLNAVLTGWGFFHLGTHPELFSSWTAVVRGSNGGNPLLMIVAVMLMFQSWRSGAVGI